MLINIATVLKSLSARNFLEQNAVEFELFIGQLFHRGSGRRNFQALA
jgi:hypothetical protein